MTEYLTPSIDTHVALTEEIPKENLDQISGRPDMPTPSLWQKQVKLTHRVTGKPCIVVRVDHAMMMFRGYYPTERNADGALGRFAERTEWEHCRDWEIETTFSPAELERQAAKRLLEEQIEKLDATQIALAKVLCDDADPNKALAKLRMLIQAGLVKVPEEIAPAVLPDLPPEPVQRVRKKPEPKQES
jgi:hypothetical protein